MNSERREEMISAYLDGELSAEERAQVEAWLAESLELRQLHDELKALGASIQALPRHQLTQDLQAAVLRRAEQSVLAGGAARNQIAGDVRPASKAPLWLRGAGWRRLAWPAVAIAAALVVMLFDAEQAPAPREVAQAPKGPTSIAARQETPSAKLAAKASPQSSAPTPAQTAAAPAKPSAAMSQFGATPGEAAAGGAAIDAAAPAANTVMRRAAPQSKEADALSAPLETLVYRVSPEFLSENSLETMLAKSQIAWHADPSFGYQLEKRDEPVAAEALATTDASPPGRKVYVLQVSDEQRTRILGELAAKSDQVKKIDAKTVEAKKLENLARDVAGAAAERSDGVTVGEESAPDAERAVEIASSAKKTAALRPLRIVLEASAAEPAPGAPAAGEAKP